MEPGGADTCLNLLYRYVPPLLKGVAWGAIWLILSPDLVLAVLGQKRGEGEGEEETLSLKLYVSSVDKISDC